MRDGEFTPFDAEGGLILATSLPGSAEAFASRRRSWEDLNGEDGAQPLWIHLDRTKPGAQAWLRDRAGLDAMVIESLLAEETRPSAQPIGEGMLVILRGVNMNPGAEPDDLISIRMWAESSRVITLRQHRFQTIAALRRLAQEGRAPATPGAFLAHAAAGLTERLGPVVENLEEMLDEIEEAMLAPDIPDERTTRASLATIRRQAIAYRRYLVPQRDALHGLLTSQHPLLGQGEQARLRVAVEQTTRVLESLEAARDRAAVTGDELRARREERMGRTVYLLTLVATVMLPLGLVTGLLGINVGGIPLADSPLGFGVVAGALVLLAAGEVLLLRSLRWL